MLDAKLSTATVCSVSGIDHLSALDLASSTPSHHRGVFSLPYTGQTVGSSPDAQAPASRLDEIYVDLMRFAAFKDSLLIRYRPPQWTAIEPAAIPSRAVYWQSKRLNPLPPWLDSLVADEPLEDGFDHPAESALLSLASESGDSFCNPLATFIAKSTTDNRRGTLAILAARTGLFNSKQRFEIIAALLKERDLFLRDAAIRAAELWEDSSLIEVLKCHDEPTPWLASYLEDVIDAISEN